MNGGKREMLGTFDSAKDASDAYVAASNVYSDVQRIGRRRLRGRREGTASDKVSQGAVEVTGYAESKVYKGVHIDPTPGGLGLCEAVFVTKEGREVSGGEYESPEEAAKAYDALARMYLGDSAETNFPIDPYTTWIPPEEVVHTGQIEVKVGVPLTVEEITAALTQERAVDVRVVPLAGRSDLAETLIFATGRSVPHMKKMADMVARALRKRSLNMEEVGGGGVEGRDAGDWMLVDCGNIVVNIMDAEAREVFDLEKMYENMEIGKDPYAGLSYEEWLDANPIPEKWLARLERDEEELTSSQRISGGRGERGRGGASASPNPHHFPKKMGRGK